MGSIGPAEGLADIASHLSGSKQVTSSPTQKKTAEVSQNVFSASRKETLPSSTGHSTSSTAVHQLGSGLKSHFQLAPELRGLSEEQKELLFKKCIDDYHESVVEYEGITPNLAWSYLPAKAFAQEFCRRISAIAEAFFEITQEKETLSPVMLELKRVQNLTRFFQNDSYGAGSVGVSPIAIRTALQEGNLRELLMLIYAAVFSDSASEGTLLSEIFSNTSLIQKINERLALLPKDQCFQIEISELDQHVIQSARWYKNPPSITHHREVEHGRETIRPFKTAPADEAEGPLLSEVKDLSLREARVGLQDYVSDRELEALRMTKHDSPDLAPKHPLSTRHLGWLSAEKCFKTKPESTFAQRAIALGGLPIISGPSGTTNGFFHAATLLGMQDQLPQGILALSAWMIPTHDHSLHEIRLIGNEFGVPYTGSPEDFETLYDPAFCSQIQTELESRQLHMPRYYLGQEHQLEKAREMGLVA